MLNTNTNIISLEIVYLAFLLFIIYYHISLYIYMKRGWGEDRIYNGLNHMGGL